MNRAKRTSESRLIDGGDLHHSSPLDSTTDQTGCESAPVTYHCPRYEAGHQVTLHHHRRAQLLYAVSGIMTVNTLEGTWTVPPQQAVWIPPGFAHEVFMPCTVMMRSLYLHPELVADLPDACKVVEVTPLLRELIARLVDVSNVSESATINRLIDVLVDEIRALDSPPLYLPAPRDARLKILTNALLADPSDKRDLEDWSHHVGASSRTLARLFRKETGMSFAQWRRQLRLLNAIERLARGEDVTRIALELGYGSASAFIAMFKRILGKTPGQYVNTTSAV